MRYEILNELIIFIYIARCSNLESDSRGKPSTNVGTLKLRAGIEDRHVGTF